MSQNRISDGTSGDDFTPVDLQSSKHGTSSGGTTLNDERPVSYGYVNYHHGNVAQVRGEVDLLGREAEFVDGRRL
jgi:hypothetical protein